MSAAAAQRRFAGNLFYYRAIPLLHAKIAS